MQFLSDTEDTSSSSLMPVGGTGYVLQAFSGRVDGFVGERVMKLEDGSVVGLGDMAGKVSREEYSVRMEQYSFMLADGPYA